MGSHQHTEPAPRAVHGVQQERNVLDNVAQALVGLRFGSVEIVVHEGKVTQIERKEKIRL